MPWPSSSLQQTKTPSPRLNSKLGFNRPWLLWLMRRMDNYLKVRADTFHPLYNIRSQQTEAAWLVEGRGQAGF